MVTVVRPYSQFCFFFLWCRFSSLFFCIEYTVIPPPFVTNFTKITFHNGTISTSLFNKNWPYSVKQDKQVLHSFAFWGSSTPPPANTHTHTHTHTHTPENINCKIPETNNSFLAPFWIAWSTVPLCSALDANHFFVQRIPRISHSSASPLSARPINSCGITVLVFK